MHAAILCTCHAQFIGVGVLSKFLVYNLKHEIGERKETLPVTYHELHPVYRAQDQYHRPQACEQLHECIATGMFITIPYVVRQIISLQASHLELSLVKTTCSEEEAGQPLLVPGVLGQPGLTHHKDTGNFRL